MLSFSIAYSSNHSLEWQIVIINFIIVASIHSWNNKWSFAFLCRVQWEFKAWRCPPRQLASKYSAEETASAHVIALNTFESFKSFAQEWRYSKNNNLLRFFLGIEERERRKRARVWAPEKIPDKRLATATSTHRHPVDVVSLSCRDWPWFRCIRSSSFRNQTIALTFDSDFKALKIMSCVVSL